MKKAVLCLILLCVVSSLAFAGMTLGVTGCYHSVGPSFGMEGEAVGFDVNVQLPVWLYASELIRPTSDTPLTFLDFLSLPLMQVNLYGRVVRTRVFNLNLGILTSASAILPYQSPNWAFSVFWGPSMDLSFKVNDRFSFFVRGSLPAMYLLSWIEDMVNEERAEENKINLAQYGGRVFFSDGNAAGGLVSSAFTLTSHLAQLGLQFTL